MRVMKALILCLLFSVPCFAQAVDIVEAPAPKYEVKYDKFQLETRFRPDAELRADDIKGVQMRMSVHIVVPDKGKPHYALSFSPSRSTLYTDPTLRILTGNFLMEIKSTQLTERPIFELRWDQFERITKSKKVELQLALFEGEIREETITAMRQMYEVANKPN